MSKSGSGRMSNCKDDMHITGVAVTECNSLVLWGMCVKKLVFPKLNMLSIACIEIILHVPFMICYNMVYRIQHNDVHTMM